MKRILLLTKLLILFVVSNAQTVLISPTGDGGFENGSSFAANGWTVANGATNQWFIGSVAPPSLGANCAYISNDLGGATYNYATGAASTVHFYRDVTFPVGETDIQLTYKWKCFGEGSYDYIAVFAISTALTPTFNSPAGAFQSWLQIPTAYPGATVLNTPPQNLQANFQTATICLPAGFAGTTQRLVFMFSNDPSVGTQPPASIDEISLISNAPGIPTNQPSGLTLTPISTSQINGSFTAAPGLSAGYLVVRYPTGATPTDPVNGTSYLAGQSLGLGTVVQTGPSTTFSATGLSANTTYDFYIYNYTGSGCSPLTYLTGSPLFGTATTLSCSGITGLKTVGPTGDYPSLTAAMAVVNLGITGAVTLELQSTYSSAVETFPITFPSNACVGPINTLIIRPELGAAGLSIVGINTTAIFDFNGATYVTIDGRPGGVGGYTAGTNLMIRNTAVGPTIRYINDAQFNVVKYCDIQGQNTTATNITTQGGVVCFSTTTGANGNDNNIIDFCDIHETPTGTPVMGIFSYGSQTTVSQNNDNNTISNCNIYNVFSASIADAFIKIDLGNSAWTINNNRFYQTATRTYTTGAVVHRVMWITPNVGGLVSASNFTITNNFIGGNNAAGTGTYTVNGLVTHTFSAIDLSVGLGTPSSVQNNTITNINFTTSSTAVTAFVGIGIANGNINIGTITGNTIGSDLTNGAITFTTSGSLGGVMGIRMYGGGTINIANNKIGGINLNGNTVAQAPSFSGIARTAGTTATINNNLIGSTTVSNSVSVQSATTSVSAAAMNGINNTGGTTTTITNNIIANINCNSVAVGAQAASVRGIILTSSVPTITGNIITNLSNSAQITGTGANCAIVGMSVTSGAGVNTISNNTIKSLQLTHPTNNSAVQITGMFINNFAGGTNIISRNNIHSFGITSPLNTLSVITGIDCGGGVSNYFNNTVNLGIDSNGNSITQPILLRGITKGTASNNNFYYNSVYIGGSNVAAGVATQSTFAFVRGTTGTDQVRNNIFVNERSNAVAGGLLKHYAIRLSTGVATLTINNNNYYGIGNDGILGSVSGIDYPTFAGFQGVTLQDVNSLNETVNFINATGNAASKNMHINVVIPTGIDNGATNIVGITNDIDLDVRQGNVGYLGTGFAPDMGADEFEAVLPNCAAANGGTITPSTQTKCDLQTVTMTCVGATTGAGITRQWKIANVPGGPYVNVTGGTGATTLSYTSDPLTPGIYYYVLETTCAFGPIIGLSNEVTVTVNALPTIAISPNSGTICNPGGAAITLTATGATTYTWSPILGLTPNVGDIVSANPSITTTYTVTGIDANGCTSTSSAAISVGNTPVVNSISASPSSVCAGGTTSLTADATVTTGVPGVYTVTSIPFAPVTPTGAPTVIQNGGVAIQPLTTGSLDDGTWTVPLPVGFNFSFYGTPQTTLDISTNGFIGFGGLAGLSGCCSGQVLPNATTPNNVVALAWEDWTHTAGTLDVFTNGVAPNRKFVIRVQNVPRFGGTGAPTTAMIVLNETSSSIEIHNTSVTAGPSDLTTQGIENAGGTAATVVPGRNSTSWTATNEAWLFQSFVQTPISNYTWSPAVAGVIANPNQQTTNANPTINTIYTVTATSAIGCTATSSVNVDILPVVTGTASVSPTPICLGGSATFVGSVPTSCPGGSVSNFAGAYAPANWVLTQVNSNGTVNTAGAPLNIILTSGTNGSNVDGSTNYTKTIDCAGTVSFNWSYTHPDAFLGSIFDYPRLKLNGTYVVPVTGEFPGFAIGLAGPQNGTVTLPVNAGDVVELQAYTIDNDPTPCTVTITNFSAPTPPVGGTVTYWDAPIGGTNLGAPPIPVTPAVAGPLTYYAEYTALGSGCVNPVRDVVTLTVNSLPTVGASASPAIICESSSSTLTGSGAATYGWEPGALVGNPSVTPSVTTTYTVTGTDGNGCTGTATTSVTVISTPAPSPVTATPSSICLGDLSDLNAISVGNTINWFTVPSGGVSLGSTASGVNFPVTPGATTTYYAESVNAGGGPGGSQTFNYTGSIQTFTVPAGVTSITMEARGAQGGSINVNCVASGGLGARMIGDVAVTPGEVISVLVGQQGFTNGADAGGGGGSFVVRTGNIPLVVAGGGGGASNNIGNCGVNLAGGPGLTTLDGGASGSGMVAGGINGNGGGANFGSGGGGGGFFTDGIAGSGLANNNGKSYLNGGIGGTGNNNDFGGYGGGGAGWFTGGNGGGGGGYSGGGTDGNYPTVQFAGGGGGGSYNIGANQSNTAGFQSGDGLVIFTWSGGGLSCPSVVRTPVTVTVNPTPVINATTTPSTTCNLTSVNPCATGAVTYVWTGGLTNCTPFVATTTDTYTVTGTDGAGCTGTSSVTVTVTPASGVLAPTTSNQSQDHGDDFNINYYAANCDLIATVDDGAGGNVLGLTTSTVNVDATASFHNGQPFVRRWYQITPTTNGSADVKLYINQTDFDDYNAAVVAPYLPLPTGPGDASGIANIRITKNDDGGLGNNPIVITPAVSWNGTYWELSFNTPSFSQFRVHSVNPGNVPLPVTVTSFSGTKLESSDKLSWITSSEQNNAYFNLQHSTDGISFSTIAKVASKAPNGNSNTALSYTATNNKPALGHNYYRLQQVDIDNKVSVHAQIVDLIWGANGSTVSIYPNPTTDILNIDLYATAAQNTTVKLLDMSGRVIRQVQAKSSVGMNNIQLSLGEIASGVYTVQVYENNHLTHTSKVKKND
jgi:hypothetical protein